MQWKKPWNPRFQMEKHGGNPFVNYLAASDIGTLNA